MSSLHQLHDAARATTALVRARWADDDEGAAMVLATMSPDERGDALWAVVGLVEAALAMPPDMPRDAFLDALGRAVDRSEQNQNKETN